MVPTSNDKQKMWLNCFIFWLFFEILIVKVMQVSLVHMLLPSLVMEKLTKARIQFKKVLTAGVIPFRPQNYGNF
jgi:hypothetical protein